MRSRERLALAARYTLHWRRGYLSSFLSLLSMLGLVLAVALLILVLSVMNGFDREMREIQSKIGYLPENCPVWPEMTVIDFLEYQAHLHGVDESKIQTAVVDAIRRTALKEKATAPIQTLSRGYRQRVGVAQAILILIAC